MTVSDLLLQAYAWLDARAFILLACGFGFAAAAAATAAFARTVISARAGEAVANVAVIAAVALLMLEVLAVLVARLAFEASLLDANAVLLLAPLATCAATLVAIHFLLPLNRLASVRTLGDVLLFALACAAVLWFLSTFRGWGIIFFGSILELIIIAVLVFLVLRRLYRRAFGRG